jgi:hypothetical protein
MKFYFASSFTPATGLWVTILFFPLVTRKIKHSSKLRRTLACRKDTLAVNGGVGQSALRIMKSLFRTGFKGLRQVRFISSRGLYLCTRYKNGYN